MALPEWVRGRGLAIFLTVYFGALTLGSAVWGEVATVKGVPFALTCAGAGTLIGMALTWAWKLQTSEAQDLTPSMRWRAPSFLDRVTDDRGPILAIAEYRIDPKDSQAFLAVMQDISLERKRDGAYAWHIFEDPDDEGKIDRDLPRPFRARTQISRVARHQGRRNDRGSGGAVLEGAGRNPFSGPSRSAPGVTAFAEGAAGALSGRRACAAALTSSSGTRGRTPFAAGRLPSLRRADLLDAARVHDRDAVGDLHRLGLVVGDEDRREPGAVVNFAQPNAQVLADLGVQRAERLVEQEHARLDGERAGEGDALLLPAGELRGIARPEISELDDVEQFVDPRARSRAATAACAAAARSDRRRHCRTRSCAGTGRSAGRRSRCAAPGSRAAPASSPSKASAPSLIGSSPAMRRRSVVLPEPEGPSSARSSPGATLRSTRIESAMGAEALRDAAHLDPARREGAARERPRLQSRLLAERGADAPFENGFEAKRDQRQKGEEGRQSEGCPDVVLIVEDLHLKRDRVGEAADVAGDDRHRAEFAHRSRVAEQDAGEQRPADVGQRHGQEGGPAARAERQRGLLVGVPELLHDRDELARDERAGHEHRRQRHAGNREDDLDLMRGEPGSEQPLRAEHQHEDQAAHHRRHGERQVDQGDERALAGKLEFGDRPGRANPEQRR